jgi:hypothetical protein
VRSENQLSPKTKRESSLPNTHCSQIRKKVQLWEVALFASKVKIKVFFKKMARRSGFQNEDQKKTFILAFEVGTRS